MKDLVDRLRSEPVVALTTTEYEWLVESARVLRSEDTGVTGRIRILEVGGSVVVQERSPRGERYARAMTSHEDANRFVDNRLDTYERMWDGCGCKVDYAG